jgi:hypothetical protein
VLSEEVAPRPARTWRCVPRWPASRS